jgi:hypothetical protein
MLVGDGDRKVKKIPYVDPAKQNSTRRPST